MAPIFTPSFSKLDILFLQPPLLQVQAALTRCNHPTPEPLLGHITRPGHPTLGFIVGSTRVADFSKAWTWPMTGSVEPVHIISYTARTSRLKWWGGIKWVDLMLRVILWHATWAQALLEPSSFSSHRISTHSPHSPAHMTCHILRIRLTRGCHSSKVTVTSTGVVVEAKVVSAVGHPDSSLPKGSLQWRDLNWA